MNEPKPNPTLDLTAAASSIPPITGTGSDTLGVPAGAASAVPPYIGRYVLLDELGRGGMGVVYRAEDPRLKREVALKVMLPQFAANPQAKARFVREARAQAKVEHDHVAAIFEVDEHDGLPYLAMPLLKGMTLQAALKANPRPPLPEVVRLGREMAEGLAAAHEKGLVHRDIKPANVWLEGKKLRVKVLDFGLARVSDTVIDTENSETGPVTHQGAIVGTPAYMSPEQARGDAVDGRTDLWSLGVVLYQMTTGELPFSGKSVLAILARLAADTPPLPITKNPAVSQPLSDFVMRLLAKDPANRPATAEIAAEELRAIEVGGVNAVRVIPLGDLPPIIVADANAGPDPFVDLDATEANSAPDVEPIAEPISTQDTPKATARSGFPVWAMVLGVLLAVGAIVGLVVSEMGKKKAPEVQAPEGGSHSDKAGAKGVPGVGTPTGPLPATYKNSIGMEFVKVPKGTAWLGGGGGKPGETKVEIKADFYLGKYEVTQGEWEAVTGLTPSQFKRGNDKVKDIPDADLKRFPVEQASWDDCQLFLEKLAVIVDRAMTTPAAGGSGRTFWAV